MIHGNGRRVESNEGGSTSRTNVVRYAAWLCYVGVLQQFKQCEHI